MPIEEEQAKVQTNEGLDDTATTTPPEIEKPVEQPVKGKEEGTEPPAPTVQELQDKLVKSEAQLTTAKANLKQATTEVNELKRGKTDFEGLRETVTGFRADLNLVTDVLSEMTTDNEELQKRVTKTRQDREASEQKVNLTRQIYHEMGQKIGDAEKVLVKAFELEPPKQIGELVHLSMADESLKPAFAAADKGDMNEAIRLTNLAVESKITTLAFTKPVVEEEPTATLEEKKKLAVNTSSPAPSQDWREKSAEDRVKGGMEKARIEHGW